MNTIRLSKDEIKKAIEHGDNCNGGYVLASDGIKARIHWCENSRQWNPWPEGWNIISIPALDPEGSGRGSFAAKDLLKMLGLHDSATDLIDEADIGWVEAAERLAPDDWSINQEEAISWLLDAFLDACNGHGDELNDPSPWGYEYDEEGVPDEIPQPAIFVWDDQEESLSYLAERCGISYNTLARYAREGRFAARKSGGVWLSTVAAVEAAWIKTRS